MLSTLAERMCYFFPGVSRRGHLLDAYWTLDSQRYSLTGAGNVIANLIDLGGALRRIDVEANNRP